MRAQALLQRGASSSASPSATGRCKPLRQWQVCRAATTIAPVAQSIQDDFTTDKRPVILYDGVCNLCNGAVDFMLQWDTAGRFRMAALQSKAGERLLARCQRQGDISSIVVVEENTHHIRSDAVLRIAREIGNPWPLFALLGYPVPHFLRDFAYDRVANNRYSFMGQRDVCRVSNAGFEDRFIVE